MSDAKHPIPDVIAVWRFHPDKADEWLEGGWSQEHDHKTTSYTRTEALAKQAVCINQLEKALKDIIGHLDDPHGGDHARDMRGAQQIARAALKAGKSRPDANPS